MSSYVDRIKHSPIRYLVILGAASLGVAYTLSGYVSPQTVQLASLISGAILSFLLLVVYLEIRSSERIQANQIEQQTEILDNQQNLQKSLRRLQHEAKVRVERIEANDDTAELWLSNYGSGAADSLELVTEVILPNDPDLEGGEKPSKVHRVEEHPGPQGQKFWELVHQ